VPFHAVLCDKESVQEEEEEKRVTEPRYRYNPDHLYDRLTRSLFGKFHQMADRFQLCIAKRRTKVNPLSLETRFPAPKPKRKKP
jgi:hypothetical protein